MNKNRISDYLAFAAVSVVGILPQYLLSSFASAYYTDIALVSAGAVGLVVLIMRFTDGISDLIMGRVIDRTNTKMGKCRPWILIGGIGLVVTILMIFHVPGGWSPALKIAWFAVSYFLVMTVFATMQGVAGQTMMVYLTRDVRERNLFGAFSMAGTYLGGLTAIGGTSIFLSIWGYTQSGYDRTVLVYAPILLILTILSVIRLREPYNGLQDSAGRVSSRSESRTVDKAPLREILYGMFHNRYYMLDVAAGLLINLINGILTGMGVYFSRDVFGNAGYYAVFTIALLVPTLVGLPFSVALSKKIGNYRTLVAGRVAYTAFYGVSIAGLLTASMPLYLAGQILCGFAASTFAACFTASLANTVDYSRARLGIDGSGTMMSATSFCNKVGLGLGSAVTGLLLTLSRYDGSLAQKGIAQSAYTINAEKWSMILVPLALNIVVTVLLCFCNIDKEMPAVRRKLKEMEKDGVRR